MGNITHQPLVGTFSYDGFRVTDMLTESNLNLDDSLRIRYYKSIERPRSIENELYKADFYYDGNGDRFMMKVYKKEAWGTHLSFTRYYLADNAEVTVDTLGHYSLLYYAGGDAYTAPAVMVIDENENSSIYEITRDNLGSAILYENVAGNYYQNSYSPWGVRTYIGESTVFYRPGEEPGFGPFYRTYTGHEDLWMFGLLNANARLYSPYLGRFVSPDPLLCEDGRLLDFNPYVYARNNPYRYIDRNGEFPFFIFGAIALVGGITNVVYNKDNIHNFWQGLGYFGVGATASAACVAVSCIPIGVGGAIGGAILGGIGGGLSGFILGGGNALLSGGNFWDSALTGLWQGAASGAVLGGISGGASAHKNGQNYWTGKPHVTSNGHQPRMTEPDAMAVLPNNDDIGHTTELLRKTDSWELIENRAINRISSDCNSAIILRPNAKQYDPSLIKTDPNHTFPVVFDDDIIKYGFTKTSGNSTGYILPGFHNDNPGFFHINMNNQSGVIYHRNFYNWNDRFKMYVGTKGVNEVYFFK